MDNIIYNIYFYKYSHNPIIHYSNIQIIHQNISFKGHRSGNASGGSVDHTLLISNTVTSTQLRVYGFIEFIKNYIRHEDGSEYLGGTIAQICTNKSGCAHLVRRPYGSNMQLYCQKKSKLNPFPGPVSCKY